MEDVEIEVGALSTAAWTFLRLLRIRTHKEIQLLYFPMDDPLTPEERKARRVVSSILGC